MPHRGLRGSLSLSPALCTHPPEILALCKERAWEFFTHGIYNTRFLFGMSEDEEREFWATHDSTEFLAWSKAKRAVFPNLKPSTKSIALRLPESVLVGLKMLANKRDVPYQSLIKMWLSEKVG